MIDFYYILLGPTKAKHHPRDPISKKNSILLNIRMTASDWQKDNKEIPKSSDPTSKPKQKVDHTWLDSCYAPARKSSHPYPVLLPAVCEDGLPLRRIVRAGTGWVRGHCSSLADNNNKYLFKKLKTPHC